MKKHFPMVAGLLALSAIAGVLSSPAQAAVIANWNFDTLTVSPTTGTTSQSITADAGTGTLKGVHAASATTWSSPTGNGSVKSFSANTWGVGDYYEATFSPTGSSLYLTFDQASSNTGPRDFQIQTSPDGTTFSPLSSYIVNANASPNPTWSSTTYQPLYTTLNVVLPANTTTIRLVDNSTVSANGGTVATGGANRIDNIIISDAPVTIPEPASLSALALGGAALLLRRRK